MAFNVGSVTANITANIEGFKKGIAKAQSDIDGFKDRLDNIGDSLTNFGKKYSLFVTTPIVAAGTMALKSASDFEQLQVALTTMLGDEAKAKQLLADMQQFAATTPFEYTELAAGTKQLLAYGFAQGEIIDATRMLGDVSAGLSIPIGDMIYLYGTLRAQQIAYTKDLNQFANRGVPIWDELANVMGKSVPEVRKLVETGQVGFPIVEQAFKNMTGEGGKFHDLMQKQSETTAGQFSNLQDSVGFLARDLGTLLLPYAIQLIETLRGLVDWVNSLSDKQKQWIVIILAVVAAIGPLLIILGTLVSGIGAVITIINAVGVAMTFLIANPIALLIIAIVALFLAWQTNFLGIRDIVNNVWSAIQYAFNAGLNFLKNIANSIFDAITWPFREAKKTVEEAVNFIKDHLDFTQRHSPSVLDVVNRGVSKVNKALGNLAYDFNLMPNTAALSVANTTQGPSINNIRIDLANAVIADEYSANRIGEVIGDSIINKLKTQVRF